MKNQREKELLEKIGCENIETTILNLNYYYTFKKDNKKYSLMHVLDVYGEEVDVWELFPGKDFNTFEEVLEHLKEGKI